MKKIFNGAVRLEHERVVVRPAFLQELSQYIVDLNLSGEDVLDWAWDRLFIHHNGPLLFHNGDPYHLDDQAIETAFGVDGRRWINSFKKAASKRPAQRLHESLIDRIWILDSARKIDIEIVKITVTSSEK